MSDIVTIASKEVGYKEGTRGRTKYGTWLGNSQMEWCHAFVSWCAYQADVEYKQLVPKTASTESGLAWFKAEGRFKERGEYVPKRNDLIYFNYVSGRNTSHVGVVEESKNGWVFVIEGNAGRQSNECKRNAYPLTDSAIVGYGIVSEYGPYVSSIDDSLPKPIGLVASSPKDNTVQIMWDCSDLSINMFNVFIDGAIVANGVAKSIYSNSSVSAGEHTVSVESCKGASVSKRVKAKVTVKGKNLNPSGGSGGTASANTLKATNKKKSKGSSSKSAKEELKYLKQFLKTIDAKNAASKNQQEVSYTISKVNTNHKVKIDMIVQNGKKLFSPPVIEGLKIVWERKNTAGKMTFQTILDEKHKIREGNPVLLSVNGKKFFYGFVFTVKHSKDKIIDVTVYDQLRYLKNKDTYIYKKKTTDALIRMIAKDMGLNIGTLSKTKHLITRAEDNLTLFDIISNSLNETLMATGNTYTLYDDCGKLMLKKPTDMKVTSSLIDADTAEDYSYNRSIDQDVYNQIKLEYQNENNGKVKFYYTRSKKNISKWGTLQYFEKIDSPKIAKLKGEVLLKLYNRISKTLQITGALGNTKVRAGSLIPVLLDLGDAKVSSFLLVDKVTHMFDNGTHKMDLSLSGGGFDSSE